MYMSEEKSVIGAYKSLHNSVQTTIDCLARPKSLPLVMMILLVLYTHTHTHRYQYTEQTLQIWQTYKNDFYQETSCQ